MYHCGMRQVGERHVAYKVDLMVWSNRLDLLALSNFKGEVQIHRLHWQKVWNLPPPKENVTVQAMAWRPDGKALAIGYSSGVVYIVDIEDKEIVDKYEDLTDEFDNSKQFGITCITWAVRADTLESAIDPNVYDDASIFLQNLPSTGEYKSQGSDENMKDFKEVQAPNQLNMLMVGYGTGYIYMNIFGRYPYGTIHLAQVTKDEFGEYKVLDICMSDDFSLMQVLYIDRVTNNLLMSLVNTSVLSAFAEEMYIVAKKHSEIVRLTSYLDQTMISITESWEHILLEMDTKMAEYAASVPEGGVSADLLELLMLGTPSDELELCLLQKLTVNDLKKFGNSIELSYSTIQKLVLKQLNIVGQSLTYYLSELRGLTRIPDRYKVLGIEENTVTEAIRACCAFLNKCLELQQVIDTSMRNYKAFFRWLFVVIVRLLGEQTSTEIVKITQQELGHIAEFLYNFDNVQVDSGEGLPEKPVKFNLERLGQYLEDQELTILPDDDDNPWHKFLKDNACLLKDNDTIFSLAEFKKFSLVQQQKHLKNAISQVFDVSKKETSKYFSAIYNIKCYEDKSNGKLMENLRICQAFYGSENSFMMAFTDSTNLEDGIHYMTVKIKEKPGSVTAMKYSFSTIILGDKKPNDEMIPVLDLQFYSSEYLSVLTQHPRMEEGSIFIQVPVGIIQINATECSLKPKMFLFNEKVNKKNISPLIEPGVFKVLDKMDGYRIAVSGGRKVAVVLSKSLRKVRIFEMEIDGDDEEDETLDTTTQSQSTNDQSTSEKQNTSAAADVTF
ncbi:anaphase-promoting complex subunit 4 [Helicoverpa zea]|uniref:anaphase-promoting complex subunit 4 n=1 Tax=Helicoverpa zea TaxID=7113 RepID=UPI001F59BDF4|nr:anaphase-promoting complex subunit 4 [Helicoverpa zea]XP_047022891.1 anaphase-promoting complex subunit 4 [Helicoverpa zea]XP_047022892.1 anaphase-promoting complex subunit 4 [Helicoverpa zea]